MNSSGRIATFLIFLCLNAVNAAGFQQQDLQSMADKATTFYPAQLDSGIYYSELVISIIREGGINSPLEEDMLDQLGWSFRRKGDMDSAEKYLLESRSLSEKRENLDQLASTMNRLGLLYRGTGRFDKSLESYQLGLKIRQQTNDIRGQAAITNNMGNLYRAMGDQEKAFESYNQSIELRKELDDPDYLSSAIMNLGIWMAIEKRFDEALDYFVQYREIQLGLRDTMKLVDVNTNIGNVYSDQGIYEKALEYYGKSVDLLEESSIKDEQSRATLMFNMGFLYDRRGYYDEAIEHTREALKIYKVFDQKGEEAQAYNNIGNFFDQKEKPDSALFYYQQSLDLYEVLQNNIEIARVLQNIGVIYNKEGSAEQALTYLLEAEQILQDTDQEGSIPILYGNIGAAYFTLKQYQTAIRYYTKGLGYARLANDLEDQKTLSFDLAEAYGEVRDFENAFKYQVIYDGFRDSLFNMDRTRTIEELITQYETERKEAEIRILTAEQAQNEALISQRTAENRTLVIGVISLMAAVLGISGWYLYSNRRKKIIAEQKEELYQREIDSLLERQQVESVTAMLEGQDKERKRLAAELHDRLGSVMSLVKLYFSSLDEDIKETKPELYQSFSEGNRFLDDAFGEVRALISELKEGKSTGLGLQKDLEQLFSKIEKVGVSVKSRIKLDTQLDALVEMNVFRIIQEALSNALKYSKATQIDLDLISNGSLRVMINDNGVGFDPETVSERLKDREGYGLGNMENRVKVLGGKFDLTAKTGSGVTIDIMIPVEKTISEKEEMK